MTDACNLTEYFLSKAISTRVIAIPSTLDGNIRHGFFECSIGFDTATKVYSQLVGNMLSDSASAIKYWYFIRLMGKDPSHLALECALKTHPNIVIVSEESNFRGESLYDIVIRICEIIVIRAKEGKNFGTVLIPEGLLSHISAYKNLITELNVLFSQCENNKEKNELAEKLLEEAFVKSKLTPWSYSLYNTLPDFMRLQIVTAQQIDGDVNMSQLETEKLIAHFVEEELKRL